jgi:hypothetical protein
MRHHHRATGRRLDRSRRDGTPIILRGQHAMDTDPIVAFAEAVAAIIRGTCPQTPPGQQWYFGHPGEVQTIQIRR